MLRKTRNEWVAALRSGEYPQIKGLFKTEEGWCGLGVLAEINGFLTPELDIMGFSRVGLLSEDYEELMELNDTLMYDFPTIARWIEVRVPVDD